MLTSRHIRIGIALIVSMGLHTVLMMNSMGVKMPTAMFQQQRKTVSMTLTSRSIQRSHVPLEKQIPDEKPIVKKIIREIPTPQPSPPAVKRNLNEKALTEEPQEAATTTETEQLPTEQADKDAARIIEAVPLYKKNPPPHYPSTARRRGYQGTVVLEVLVSRTGSVRDITLFESSGYAVLDKAAIKAVQAWSFTPATRMGQPITMSVKIPVQFVLR